MVSSLNRFWNFSKVSNSQSFKLAYSVAFNKTNKLFNAKPTVVNKKYIRYLRCTSSLEKKISHQTTFCVKENETELDALDRASDLEQYNQLVHRAQLLPSSGHQVLVIQPFVKWGPNKKELTTPDLMLDEAKALIDSLPKWTCIDAIKVPVDTLDKKEIFGSGKLDNLKRQINCNSKISAVFVSINVLRGIQKKYFFYLTH